jgi:pantetheine-phosphate adenylyltransferase
MRSGLNRKINKGKFILFPPNPANMLRVAVGGTFDPLHDGHKALLSRACELSKGGELLVGLTSDEMTRNKNHHVNDYSSRRKEIELFIKELGANPNIVKLNDPFGPTIRDNFDIIVVSPETHPVALKINEIRKKKGLKEIKLVLVDYVLADDGLPISSTRIKKGEIDEHGKVL